MVANLDRSQWRLSFSEALDLLKGGERLCREGWNGKGMYVYLWAFADVIGYRDEIEHQGLAHKHVDPDVLGPAYCFVIKTVDDHRVPWTPSHADLLAEDWRLYAEEPPNG